MSKILSYDDLRARKGVVEVRGLISSLLDAGSPRTHPVVIGHIFLGQRHHIRLVAVSETSKTLSPVPGFAVTLMISDKVS